MRRRAGDTRHGGAGSSGAARGVPLVLTVAAAYVVADMAVRWLATRDVFVPVQRVTAEAGAWLASLAGVPASVSGFVIRAGEGTVIVSALCMPLSAFAVGCALIATSRRLSVAARAWWVAMLVPVLAAVNVVRVAIVAALAAADSPLLAPVHESVLPVMLALTAVGVWMTAERVSKRA